MKEQSEHDLGELSDREPAELAIESGSDSISDMLSAIRSRTPARVLSGRTGSSYRTSTLLNLRYDHAAARDAVWAEVDLERDLGPELVKRLSIFEVRSKAASKEEYLLRPDLGRRFDEASRSAVATKCKSGAELQIVIGDGLSAAAVAAQVPRLLLALDEAARSAGWRVGNAFFIRHCRVGILNEIGDLLDPEVVVLLVGERPGLATAESLSAYMAYRPRTGHNDANRNLISNIHGRGVLLADAVTRILGLALKMRELKLSGVTVKEDLPLLDNPRCDSLPG